MKIETDKFEKQAFMSGDIVFIKKNLGVSKSHFPCNQLALVICSYTDLCTAKDNDSWSLKLFSDGKSCSWYDTNDLKLIKRNSNSKFIKY